MFDVKAILERLVVRFFWEKYRVTRFRDLEMFPNSFIHLGGYFSTVRVEDMGCCLLSINMSW